MRTQEEIKRDYEKADADNELRLVPGFTRVYEFANQNLKNKLREEYEQTYPEDKQIAIYLHKKLCRSNHSAGVCTWYYGINGVEHDWTEYSHKEYLEKARRCIENGITRETLELVLNSIYY